MVGVRISRDRPPIPQTFTLEVSCAPAEAIDRLLGARDVDLVTGMPAARAPRSGFLVWRESDGFTLMKAPPHVRTPADELSAEFQNLRVRGTVSPRRNEGSEVHVAFRWSPSRLGYLTLLWPLPLFLFFAWLAYGFVAVAIVIAVYVVVVWPRDVQSRRRELVSKLSDALGPVLTSGAGAGPYRSLAERVTQRDGSSE
jgi:hypothetical protein